MALEFVPNQHGNCIWWRLVIWVPPMAWMPEPVWLEIAGLGVEYSALYAALSFWTALLLFSRNVLREGESTELCADWVPYGIVGAMVGARLGYFAFEIPTQFLSEPGGLLWHPGFSFHGAVLGLLGGSVLFAWQQKRSIAKTLDQLTLSAAIGFLFTSLGGLLSNEVVGVEGGGWLSMLFPIYDEGNLLPPTRIAILHIQVIWAGIVAIVALHLERAPWMKTRPPGLYASLIAAAIFAGLIVLDPFKEERSHVAQSTYRLSWVLLDSVGLLLAAFFARRASRLGRATPESAALRTDSRA